jgi:hypothetical protein
MSNLDLVSAKLQQYLTTLYTGVEVMDANQYTLRHGSARAFLQVTSKGDDSPTVIKIDIPVLTNVRADADTEKWVALHSDDYLFGHFSLYQRESGEIDLYLSHRLLGDYLDEAEVEVAVSWMLSTANDVDEELQAQLGGSRFHES